MTGDDAFGSPTGTVTFYQCGPTADPTPCTSTANQVGLPITVTAGADDTSTATSASFTPPSTGEWCFAAVYSGDGNYDGSSDTTTDGCFDVTTASTSTVGTPTSPSIVLGSSNTDGATVTGNATGGSPTGTVTFYQCGPTADPTPCTSTANQVGLPVTVTAGADDTSTATSASFTPPSTGEWCFAAVYSGDSNYAGSSDTTTDGCFDVTTLSSSTTDAPTTGSIVLGGNNTDGAVITGDATGGDPTGTVSFYACGPTPGPVPCTMTGDQVGTAVDVTAGADDTATATSALFTPTAAGDVVLRRRLLGRLQLRRELRHHHRRVLRRGCRLLLQHDDTQQLLHRAGRQPARRGHGHRQLRRGKPHRNGQLLPVRADSVARPMHLNVRPGGQPGQRHRRSP